MNTGAPTGCVLEESSEMAIPKYMQADDSIRVRVGPVTAVVLQEFEAMSMADRPRDFRETGEYLLFWAQA